MEMMKLTQLNNLPCTYWHQDAWYDLTNIAGVGSSDYWNSEFDSYGTRVTFNFCQKLSHGQKGDDPDAIKCTDMDLYAIENTKVETTRPDPICTPLSTSSLSSVE